MVIKRVGVLSMAKLYAVIMTAIGVCFAVLVAAVGSIGSTFQSSDGESLVPFGGFGIAAIMVLPIIYAMMGFIEHNTRRRTPSDTGGAGIRPAC